MQCPSSLFGGFSLLFTSSFWSPPLFPMFIHQTEERAQPGSFRDVKLLFPCNTCFLSTPASKTFFIRHPSLCSSYVKRRMYKRWWDHRKACMLPTHVFKFCECFTFRKIYVSPTGSVPVSVRCYRPELLTSISNAPVSFVNIKFRWLANVENTAYICTAPETINWMQDTE
jgi:hypothetical protein